MAKKEKIPMRHFEKQTFRTTVIAGALTLLCATGASAAALGTGTVDASALRLRQSASTSAAIIGTAYRGEQVTVLERAGEWYKVSYGGAEGYMHGDYLNVTVNSLGTGVVTVSDSLNVRTGPGVAYSRIDSLSNGSAVELTGQENGWYAISYGQGKTGWVSGDCIRLGGTGGESGPSQGTALEEQIVAYAKQFLGVPYVWAGNGPKNFDCSGFTKYVYANFGYNIYRTASTQLQNDGRAVSRSELRPGDLVFFKNPGETKACSHVGIYIGGGQFIHASSGAGKVTISDLTKGWYYEKYVGAKRIL